MTDYNRVRNQLLEFIDKNLTNPRQKSQLRQAIEAVHNSEAGKVDAGIETYRKALSEITEAQDALFTEARAHFEDIRKHVELWIHRAIDDPDRQLEKERAQIGRHLGTIETDLRRLSLWTARHVKPLPLVNVEVMDMNWFTDFVVGMAKGRVKERVDGIIELIKQPTTLESGILRHGIMIPWLEKKGKLPKTTAASSAA